MVGTGKPIFQLYSIMTSVNKKNKAKNSYMANANKTTVKLKRINFFNKKNRANNKRSC